MIQNVAYQPNTPMMGQTRVTAAITPQIAGATMLGFPQAKLTDANGVVSAPTPMNPSGGSSYVAIIGSAGLTLPFSASVTVQWQVMQIVNESATS